LDHPNSAMMPKYLNYQHYRLMQIRSLTSPADRFAIHNRRRGTSIPTKIMQCIITYIFKLVTISKTNPDALSILCILHVCQHFFA
jgi:hypothetical protein